MTTTLTTTHDLETEAGFNAYVVDFFGMTHPGAVIEVRYIENEDIHEVKIDGVPFHCYIGGDFEQYGACEYTRLAGTGAGESSLRLPRPGGPATY